MSASSRPVIITPDNDQRFQSFILFEPAATRINDIDILAKGEDVIFLFEKVYETLTNDDLKTQILKNRLSKVNHMLNLLTNVENIILSKFFDRIWRRYGYISNIGEQFLDLRSFQGYFPEYADISQLVAQRLDDEDEDDIDNASEEDNDDTLIPEINQDDNEEKNEELTEKKEEKK